MAGDSSSHSTSSQVTCVTESYPPALLEKNGADLCNVPLDQGIKSPPWEDV